MLATEADGAALVVDWKSDRVAGDDLEAVVERSYATQRSVYALAALRAGWPRVHVVHCFLERPQETVTATFAADDVQRLEDEIGALADPLLRGEFAPTLITPPRPVRDLPRTPRAVLLRRGDDAQAAPGPPCTGGPGQPFRAGTAATVLAPAAPEAVATGRHAGDQDEDRADDGDDR